MRPAIPLVTKPKAQVIDLVPRLSSATQVLVKRVKELNWETLLEDQMAVLATYEWQLRRSERISEETARRYAIQIESFLKGLGEWPLVEGAEGPITLWHLGTPGLGTEILHSWREALAESDEVTTSIFGDAYRAVERLFRDYICRPGAIADYQSLSRLGRGITQQTGTLLLADRYGPLTNPFPEVWRPGKKYRRKEPVPRYADWLQVLDAMWAKQSTWLRTLPMKKAFPRVRTVAMIHLQSAAGPRPSELCLVKQGDLLPDRLRILHGGEKDGLPKSDKYDVYGNRMGRLRETSLEYVPAGLHKRLIAWLEVLRASGRTSMRPEGALFPTNFGAEENCVSYERYRVDFKTVLLDIAEEPSVRGIFGAFLAKPSPDEEVWQIWLTPHTVRAIYATHRMDLCDGPGAFRRLMEDLGWLTPSTILQYDRPKTVDPQQIQEQLMSALTKGSQQ
jgi:hypothetical protein